MFSTDLCQCQVYEYSILRLSGNYLCLLSVLQMHFFLCFYTEQQSVGKIDCLWKPGMQEQMNVGQQAIFCVVPKGRCRCRTYNTEEEEGRSERAFLDLGTSIRGRFMKKRKKSFPLVLICCCSTLLFSSLDLYKSMFQMLLTAALHLIKEYTWKLDTTEEAEQLLLLLLVRRGVWTPSGTRTHFVILPCFSPLLVIPRNCPGGQADALPPSSFPLRKL